MALPTPALPSISLHGGERTQARIREHILGIIPAEGILLERLFDGLSAEAPENSTYVVAKMFESRELEYAGENDRVYIR